MKLTWPDFKLPPIKLWSLPKQHRDFMGGKQADRNKPADKPKTKEPEKESCERQRD